MSQNDLTIDPTKEGVMLQQLEKRVDEINTRHDEWNFNKAMPNVNKESLASSIEAKKKALAENKIIRK